jgi:diaminopimelate decarboxylase
MDAAGRSSTLSVTGPWFDGLPDEIDACLRGRRPSRVMVNFDSTDQLAALPLAPGVQYGLRIGLDLASDREHSPGNLLTRFGVDAGDVAGIKALARRVPISGFHCHIGRETNDHDVYRELADTLIGLARALGLELEYLNLGGGLRPDVEPRAVGELVADLRRRVPRRVRLLLEPGNWWFAGAGFAVGRVVGVKPMRDGALRATLDLSKDCHLRWAKPRVVAAGDGAQRVKVCFAGPTLYEGDVLGAFDMPSSNDAAPVCVGDTVVFAGVTGYAAGWNTSFNGVPQARVLLHGIDG